MKDIVDRFETNVGLFFGLLLIGYLYINFQNYEGDWKIIAYVYTTTFLIGISLEMIIGYLIRTIYTIEPKSIFKITDSLGIYDLRKIMNTYHYGHDYVLKNKFFKTYSQTYLEIKDKLNTFKYLFRYISITPSNKLNKDVIELTRTSDMNHAGHLKLTLKFDLKYDYETNSFSFKNNYPEDLFSSLKLDKPFEVFKVCMEGISQLMITSDFEKLVSSSHFQLQISYNILRRLFFKNIINHAGSYRLDVDWNKAGVDIDLGEYKDCFISGVVCSYMDDSLNYAQLNKKEIANHPYLQSEYKVFNFFANVYEIEEDKIGVKFDYTKLEDLNKWKMIRKQK